MNIVRQGRNIILQPLVHMHTLIWMHGLGDSAEGYLGLFQDFDLIPNTKVVLLTAPSRPVSWNGGARMNSWYDIIDLESVGRVNNEAIESADSISRTIEEEKKTCSSVILGGFSQGAAMSLYTGLVHYQGKLDGIIALSGYAFEFEVPEEKKQTPIFMYNGQADQLVQEAFAKESVRRSLNGCNLRYMTEKNLVHTISIQELETAKSWIHSVLYPN